MLVDRDTEGLSYPYSIPSGQRKNYSACLELVGGKYGWLSFILV